MNLCNGHRTNHKISPPQNNILSSPIYIEVIHCPYISYYIKTMAFPSTLKINAKLILGDINAGNAGVPS